MDANETKNVIRKIKERRLQLGLSYQDLADKTGISKSTLQRYESGSIKNLSIDKLEVLAEALETSPGYLMGWEDENASINSSFKGQKISSAKEAMEFILKQPVLMAYGGYDVKKMSDEDLVNFANDLLEHLELLSLKYKK